MVHFSSLNKWHRKYLCIWIRKSGFTDQNANLVEMTFFVAAIAEVFWSFAFIFFICECGEGVTSQFNNFDDKLCECKWYLFPMDMQKLYLIFMINTQQPTHISCYGNILCVREMFKKVRPFTYLLKSNKLYFDMWIWHLKSIV